MKTIFQVSAAYDCRGFRQRHYPSYQICWGEIMIATSLDAAERFIKTQTFDKDVLMYSVKENKINVGHYDSQCLTERIYDRKGILIDSRMFSTFGEGKNSKFYGRKPSEIRFSKGEFVEVVGYHEAYLGMVVGVPITEEEVQEINKKTLADGVEELQFDRFDDSYNVLSYDKECSGLGHVNSLRMIKPRFKVSEYQKDYYQGLYYEFEHFINGDELEDVVL